MVCRISTQRRELGIPRSQPNLLLVHCSFRVLCAMQLVAFLALLSVTLMVKAENCTVQMLYGVLSPVAFDPNFATCQTDSNYTLLLFEGPLLNQSGGFCASSACQALLNTTLSSGLLPDCQVVIGTHSLNLSTAVAIAAKCGEAALDESAVKTNEAHNQLGHTTDQVAGVVGHSVPVDELGGVLSTILSIFR
ncbi:Elicitin [Phytophthora megakarya]|uniref:Elicitin n=1 Tax=Phytophthora megakarya TaxID=4795 RepID=A0A225WXV6_9STRA|nr:Elicitin [Phytophthora megakarya]